MDCAAIDFGGSITDVVLRRGEQTWLRSAPRVDEPGPDDLRRLVEEVSGDARLPPLVAVTGGRSAALPTSVDQARVVVIDETVATAEAAREAGVPTPAVVVSVGTGTGLVLARPPEEPLRLIGSGVGGGTLIGLSRLLLGTVDVEEIGALACSGDPARCDLTVTDIVGGPIGPLTGQATASHFGRLARGGASTERADVAAALVRLVAQTALRLSVDPVLFHQARVIVLVGHVLDVPGFRGAIFGTPGVDPSFVRVADDPGFAVARGALAAALEQP